MAEKDIGVVLVHGAWADGSSWAKVISRLSARGVRTIAANSARALAAVLRGEDPGGVASVNNYFVHYRSQLHSDFDRQRAGFEQDSGCLAVERAARGHGQARADCFAGDVVPEGELFFPVDQQVRLEKLTDRGEEIRGWPAEESR